MIFGKRRIVRRVTLMRFRPSLSVVLQIFPAPLGSAMPRLAGGEALRIIGRGHEGRGVAMADVRKRTIRSERHDKRRSADRATDRATDQEECKSLRKR